jgi:mRNA-degrading endonuclease RelE of RelBE toxin-antitoxin system
LTYQAVQTRRFARQYKKLHDNIASDVDTAVATVEASPKIGDKKKGDLSALYVYKFRSQGQPYLLGYTIGEELKLVYLEAVGPHEIFYRDLKYFIQELLLGRKKSKLRNLPKLSLLNACTQTTLP